MDLRTHVSVIWRWRLIVLLGLLLAAALAFFSVCRVSFAHGTSVTYREGQTWQASETLLLSTTGGNNFQVAPPPNSLTSLASLYVQISNSATIRVLVLPDGQATRKSGNYSAFQVLDQTGQPQPILTFDGTGTSPARAAAVARRASSQFRSYLTSQAEGTNVPFGKRVDVSVLTPAFARDAKVVKGRKLTAPILIFLAVLIATLGLAYLLENLRPRKNSAQSRGVRKRDRKTQAVATPLRERTSAARAAQTEETRPVETTRRP